MAVPEARAAFFEAADAFVEIAGAVDPAALDAPATTVWTLRELVAHAARGMLAIPEVLSTPVGPSARAWGSAADYFESAMSLAGIHAGIEQRARDAAGELGDEPGLYARDALDLVGPLVAATSDDHVVERFGHTIRFDDYLVTRVVELTLHSADVQLALGSPVSFPELPARVTRDAMLCLVDRADPLGVACALAGRAVSPPCNVLG